MVNDHSVIEETHAATTWATNHSLCCASRGALAGTITQWNGSIMKDQSDDP